MLNEKLYPVVWSIVIVGAFMLGAATQSIWASSNPPTRAVRGELPEPKSVPSAMNVTWLPREPKENIRGGMAEAYAKPEQPQTVSASVARSAFRSEDRFEQALSKFESPTVAVGVSEFPLKIRGGLAENRGSDIKAPIAPKTIYAPHSDAWTDRILDSSASTNGFYNGITDRPAKMRGGPLD